MDSKIIITKHNEHIITCLHDEKRAIQFSVDVPENESILGNIYVGRVKNIVKNINAAFVEIGDGRMCYLDLSAKQNPVYLSGGSSQKINVGDCFLVQIEKEDVKTKAPVATTAFSLTGKYCVLVHGRYGLGISGKIEDASEKKRLKKLIAPFANPSDNFGFIIRTNAGHVSEEKFASELERLLKLYKEILSFGVHKTDFSLVYQALPSFLSTIRDGFAEDVDKIITDDDTLFEQIKDYLVHFQNEDLSKLEKYDGSISLYSLKIKSELESALREKVWLKCGGSIIIQPTEALTVIDVNTEKAVLIKKEIQNTFFKVNSEAALEIARQIRLRNLSGIIIIDFIDMESEEHKKQLLDALNGYLKTDPVKTTLVDITALNLVEITRKKVRKPLYEQINAKAAKKLFDNHISLC